MGTTQISAFLTQLAERGVSASTQNQARSALLFTYTAVLRIPIAGLGEVVAARRPARLPVVLARDEISAVLGQLTGVPWLMASLMYGAGLRLMKCAELRVKDVDLGRSEVVVRDGKGGKDRVTPLPAMLRVPLTRHLARVKAQHDDDVRAAGERRRHHLHEVVASSGPHARDTPMEIRTIARRVGLTIPIGCDAEPRGFVQQGLSARHSRGCSPGYRHSVGRLTPQAELPNGRWRDLAQMNRCRALLPTISDYISPCRVG
jgi:integrase